MSTIEIPDLSARASARLGSAYQVEALARHSRRDPLNRYQPLRAPWAHGFWPGQDHRLGKWHPADAPLAEFLESLPHETCLQAYARLLARRAELEALGYVFERPVPNACVLTPPPIVGPGPIPSPPRPPRPPTQRPPVPKPPPDAERFKILDTGGIASTTWSRSVNPAPAGTLINNRAITPAPCYVVSVSICVAPRLSSDNHIINVHIEPWGLIMHGNLNGGAGGFTAGSAVPIGLLAPLGATAIITLDIPTGAGIEQTNGSLALIYRNVTGARRPDPPLAGRLPCLSIDTFDTLADAGVDLTAYDRGCVQPDGSVI